MLALNPYHLPYECFEYTLKLQNCTREKKQVYQCAVELSMCSKTVLARSSIDVPTIRHPFSTTSVTAVSIYIQWWWFYFGCASSTNISRIHQNTQIHAQLPYLVEIDRCKWSYKLSCLSSPAKRSSIIKASLQLTGTLL